MNQPSLQIKRTSFTKLGAMLLGFLFSVIIILFAGCYSTPLSYETDPEVWASSINVNLDESTGAKKLVGPRLVAESSNRHEVNFRLEGVISEQNDPLTQVVVAYFNKDRFAGYESAISDGGKHLDMEVLSSGKVHQSSSNIHYPREDYNEIVAIEIPLAYMREKAGSGFSFELTGSGETHTVEVSSPYVTGFLSKLDSYLK